MNLLCAHCRKPHGRRTGEVNRAAKDGLRLFCNRKCAGLARRTPKKPKAQRVAEKRLYDMAYREKNLALLKAKKRSYHQRTYDPRKAAVMRKRRMHLHVAYCSQPRYKAWKQDYDQKRRDSEYGPFAEAARLVINLNREVKQRSFNYEIRRQNQTGNKRQERTRAAQEGERHGHSQT